MHQLGLIGGGHDDKARQVGKKRHVERPRMRRAVGTDQTRPVDGKAYGQALDRHVMHHLIIPALQEGRINRAKRLPPTGGQTRAEGHRVLFGNAHIKGALGEPRAKDVQPGAIGHGGGDGDDLGVHLGLGDQRFGKDLGVGRRVGGGLFLLACHHVKLGAGMATVGRVFRRGIALALLGQHMDEHWPGGAGMRSAQDR